MDKGHLIEEERERCYYYTNWINLPSKIFGSLEYNSKPENIEIDGINIYYGNIFKAIARANDIEKASEIFYNSVQSVFGFNEVTDKKKLGNFRRLLRGWLFDSNSSEGAVMKGWVESRFGMSPTFHKKCISGINSEKYYEYLVEKMNLKFNKNLVYHQLDFLYTYTQKVILSFFKGHIPHIRLYRGTNNFYEHIILQKTGKKNYVAEINNLTSATPEKSIAEQFGDYIMVMDVPYTKIMFFPEVLPDFSFSGENEYIIIGGQYEIKITYY